MNLENLIIIKYEENYENIWDDFVFNGAFGTVYHTRKFIKYHPKERFIDTSILMYYKEILICVLPCCKQNNIATNFSYLGATYGGPVFNKKYTKIKCMKIIIDKIFDFYNNNIEFRIANDIYFENSIFNLYYLLSNKLRIKPELSWYIKTEDTFINNVKNKRNKSYLSKMIDNEEMRCFSTNNDDDYMNYYNILKQNLKIRFNTEPTHTLDEFLSIKKILDTKQSLYIVKNKENTILGGVYIIKVTDICWYTFYISKNIDYKKPNMSILYIIHNISKDSEKEGVKYIDYGISTENKGELLNIGLSDYKESSLGGIPNSRYLFYKYRGIGH
jgi:hypothetical protein